MEALPGFNVPSVGLAANAVIAPRMKSPRENDIRER
jgi:hypothetical protein